MTYEAELLDCLELILGTRPPDPEPGSEPLLVTRQWLAERNLGLVPVADAAGFDWPGHWIARVRTGRRRPRRRHVRVAVRAAVRPAGRACW